VALAVYMPNRSSAFRRVCWRRAPHSLGERFHATALERAGVAMIGGKVVKQKVTGIGGVFFRAQDPKSLAAWYEEHLGISDMHKTVWHQQAGTTIFGPFAATTEYFGRPEQQWMMNFRVDDLQAMMDQLKASGISIETRPEWDSEVGRFARIHDPEGNPIELWEPASELTTLEAG
jgi:glyoxylase I family protein